MNSSSEPEKDWACPSCGWDSLTGEADELEILWSRPGAEGGIDFGIRFTCPECGTEFSYCDSTY